MTNTFPKLLTVAATAAFLSISPLAAQTGGGTGTGGVVTAQELDAQTTPEHRTTMYQSFRGLNAAPWTDASTDLTIGATVPETAVRHEVPAEIVAAVPHTQGYHYSVLPDGRIVLVHPEDNTVAMILEQ